jgi:excisionase family DNA binding protein
MSPVKVRKGGGRPRGRPKLAAGADDLDLMTFQEVAKHLGCSYATVLLLVMRDRLLAFQLVGAVDGWRVRRSDLEKWIRDR